MRAAPRSTVARGGTCCSSGCAWPRTPPGDVLFGYRCVDGAYWWPDGDQVGVNGSGELEVRPFRGLVKAIAAA